MYDTMLEGFIQNQVGEDHMITIKTEIKGNMVKYTWNKRLKGLKGKTLWVEYDVDTSNMPRHLANFMFGLIVADPLSWENDTIVFDELTKEGLGCLQDFLEMYYHSKGGGGLTHDWGRYFPKVHGASFGATKLVESDQREDNGPILCANGLGKDGLTISSMTKELGFDMRCFFVDGQFTEKVMVDRLDTMNKYYNMREIESNIIKTNFFKIKGKWTGFNAYFFGIPLAYHYDSEAILAGVSVHQNNTQIGSTNIYSPGESMFGFNYVTKGSGIPTSSPVRSLSLYGVQKLLLDRYRDVLKYQRTCGLGSPWCNECAKCYRQHLWMAAYGIETTSIGFGPPNSADRDFYWRKNLEVYGFSANTALNALKKLYGDPYETWIEEANKTALELTWKGKDFKEIILDHFDVYDYDRDDDGFGWMLQPSRWRVWLEKGFGEII